MKGGLDKGGEFKVEGPEYFKILKASLEGIQRKNDDSFKYVMRIAASFTATGVVNEPTFDFLGAGGAGTFIPLPFKRMVMRRRKTIVKWRSAVGSGAGYCDHEMLFRTPAPALTVQQNFSVTLSTPINWNPDAAVLPIGEMYWYQAAANSDHLEVLPYLLGPGGFSIRVAPMISMLALQIPGQPEPVSIQGGDNVLIDLAFEFDVLPE